MDPDPRGLKGLDPQHWFKVTLCLDHIWSEQLQPQREHSGRAKKVFMTEDAVGQTYFAFLLPTNQLNLVKYKLANDDGTTMIFGATEKVPAVDAVALKVGGT